MTEQELDLLLGAETERVRGYARGLALAAIAAARVVLLGEEALLSSAPEERKRVVLALLGEVES